MATTFVAGVEAIRQGLASPIGSLTQMNTIRLGKRTEGRAPLIKDFVPLAGLDQLVFGGWDPIPDDAYESAMNSGVLERTHLDPIEDFLKGIKPMPAVFDTAYVKKLDGPNKKSAATKRDLAEALREDIRRFKEENGCDRLVMVWCGSTEIFLRPGSGPRDPGGLRKGHGGERSLHRSEHALRLCGAEGGGALCQRGPEPFRGYPCSGGAGP